MAKHFRSGMLFLRCAGGVSHHPDEASPKPTSPPRWRYYGDLS